MHTKLKSHRSKFKESKSRQYFLRPANRIKRICLSRLIVSGVGSFLFGCVFTFIRKYDLIFDMLLAVDHTQITIPKGAEDSAKAFYCEFLGLKEIEKPENRKKNGGFWLELAGFQVHVGTEDGFDRMTTKAHVAYRVSDLELWRKRFQEKGIEIFDSLPFPKARAFEFRDPFGNRAELIQHL